MSNKAVSFKMPTPKPKAADDWVEQGVEPHLKKGEVVETAPVAMKRFTIDVPVELHARIKVACAQRGKVMADVIRRMLEIEFPAGS